jgi:DNA-binding Lrp family transcriptional regulator
MEKLLTMVDDGVPMKEMSQSLGVSTPTLRARIDQLRDEQGIILEAKGVETLRVAKLKEIALGRIERNLPNMDNDDLIKTLTVLNRMDTPVEDDTGKVKGLIGLLAEIDKEADKIVDKRVEERLLEEKTFDTTSTKLPKL